MGVRPVPWVSSSPWGVASPLGPVWPPRGRCRSPGPRKVAVGACPVPWGRYVHRGGVAGPLGSVWLPWGRGRFIGHRLAAVWCGRSPGPRLAAVRAWPVPWDRGCFMFIKRLTFNDVTEALEMRYKYLDRRASNYFGHGLHACHSCGFSYN